MNSLEILLSRRWVLRSQEKELYYQIKDEIGKYQEFIIEKTGYQLILNPYLVKLEKTPAYPQPWMGIMEFREKTDYIFFCYVLMFLEDKENEEQFVLSELTEFIQGRCREVEVDWTLFALRRSLIRVMKYSEQSGMLVVDDGSGEAFARDITSEVLYENTGVSKYFVRNFTRDIQDYEKPADFGQEEWIDVNEERGIVRRQRVYRSLLMSMGMLQTEETEEDFAYIRNYRNLLQNDFSRYFDAQLQVHKGSAFLILGQESRMGRRFPEDKMLSDIVLLCCGLIREKLPEGEWRTGRSEEIVVPKEEFVRLIETCYEKYARGFNKGFREMTTSEFVREVMDYMEELALIRVEERTVYVHPVAGKLAGRYPEDFRKQLTGTEEELSGTAEAKADVPAVP